MKVASDSQLDDLQHQLISNGDWDRLRAVMLSKLNEAGWVDNLKARCKERTQTPGGVPYQALLKDMKAEGSNIVPLSVRNDVQAVIKQYIGKQVE
ncbi:hypothetical protein BDV98DRAFT_590571 [Pterulicium gracile]|uniref:Transcription and mRNA export factor SUS1 n=1 Tax=Pterulicium gracile TaxID=1884261 RepID=A0A5C3QTW4_9AGAR|nr:hypothetical protein BDV98DRAFT_590571 [Pterula gracilis]